MTKKNAENLAFAGILLLDDKNVSSFQTAGNLWTKKRNTKTFPHIKTQKERSQGTSIQQKSMHYLPRGGTGDKKV